MGISHRKGPTMPRREHEYMPRGYARKRKKKGAGRVLLVLLAAAALALAAWGVWRLATGGKVRRLENATLPGWVDVQIIEIDGASRRGESLDGFKDIVVHYIGNPGTTAQQNHDFYENPASEVSSHFIIGLDGEVIQCVPLGEKSSASNWRNNDTISIEVCHPDESGQFTQASYDALVRLTAWLCELGGLDETHVIRHYDITEKNCPKYFVENEDAWLQFKQQVAAYEAS